MTYADGVVATYAFDFAGRESGLSVDPGGGALPVATGASYLPSGPLSGLTLGNGLVENRPYTARYFPDRIEVTAGPTPVFRWLYSEDDVGNVLSIDDDLDAANDRAFGYRDPQYFLTSASGPWAGPLGWSYDRIGNWLSETRGASTDTYAYTGDGHTPVLDHVTLGGLGTRSYGFDSAGNLEEVDAAGNLLAFTTDDSGRLSRVERASWAPRSR